MKIGEGTGVGRPPIKPALGGVKLSATQGCRLAPSLSIPSAR
jgi:hypothetical protein